MGYTRTKKVDEANGNENAKRGESISGSLHLRQLSESARTIFERLCHELLV